MIIRKTCLDLQRDLAQFTGRKMENSDLYLFTTSLPPRLNQSRNLRFLLIVRGVKCLLSWTSRDSSV